MSEENVELVRRAYEAFNRGDMDGALAVLASDFEYTPSGAIPGVTETYRGPEGFKRFAGWLLDQFDDVQFEINDVVGHDDDQLVFRHTNREAEALEAAGLRE
jgi:ketosteroid isomerase-like protein